MAQIATTLLDLLRNAWLALASGLATLVLLAILGHALRTASASAVGARSWAGEALSAGMSLLLLALTTFLGAPALIQAAQSVVPASAGCGPIMDLSTLASALIGGLAAVRVMLAFYTSALSNVVGGSNSLSTALIQAGEAILGMLLASAALPIAVHFLGVC